MSVAVHETAIALEWLYSVLTGDGALSSIVTGIHRAMAPTGAEPPWVVFGFMTGSDSLTMNAVRIFSPILYQVKVVGPASMVSTLIAAANEIDDTLKRASGSVVDGLVLVSYREQPLQTDELVDGVLFTNIGGLYRLIIQNT